MRVIAKGWNMHGEPITVEGTELLARAIQHETDHLNGVVFIDRLDDATRKIAMKEIRESEWFGQTTSAGISPTIKVSPHTIFGKGL
jgi:peptide deformylase